MESRFQQKLKGLEFWKDKARSLGFMSMTSNGLDNYAESMPPGSAWAAAALCVNTLASVFWAQKRYLFRTGGPRGVGGC